MILNVADNLVSFLVEDGCNARRTLNPEILLATIGSDLALFVVPRGDATQMESRGHDDCTYSIDVVCAQRFGRVQTDADMMAAIDTVLAGPIDAIKRKLNRWRLPEGDAVVVSIRHTSYAAQEHIRGARMLYSTISLTIVERRDV